MYTLLCKLTLLVMALALAGCAALGGRTSEPESFRSLDLEGLQLVEGLNLVDRAPSGVSLVALVSGSQITEWRVFDRQGQVDVVQTSEKKLTFCQVCRLSGGYCARLGNRGHSCCWDDWGCLDCDDNGCEMDCETRRCRDANADVATPEDPEDPSTGFDVGASPDWVIAVDRETSQWTVTSADSVTLHVPAVQRSNVCPVCATGRDRNVCWELPCLPVRIEAYDPSR